MLHNTVKTVKTVSVYQQVRVPFLKYSSTPHLNKQKQKLISFLIYASLLTVCFNPVPSFSKYLRFNHFYALFTRSLFLLYFYLKPWRKEENNT